MNSIGRNSVSGISIEEYRAWMKDTCDDVLMKNDSASIDDIIESMKDVELDFKALDMKDFMGSATG